MTSLERFRSAIALQPVDRSPVWFMRQAGRYLPEYRKLKGEHSFKGMVQTPDLACEVTLQPLQRFPAIDAAILFSDILVIPEALGMPYHFKDSGGIEMSWSLQNTSGLDQLTPGAIPEKLAYVYEALQLCRHELDDRKALLGFGGSPWTLATYMVEGGSSQDFRKIKALAFENPMLLERLLETLTEALMVYFDGMIDCGVDAIQIFDSWGSICPGNLYPNWSLKWIQRLVQHLKGRTKVILFSKGMASHLNAWRSTGADVISLDASVDLNAFRDAKARTFAIQGNLDPCLLSTTPQVVHEAVRDLIGPDGGIPGHIFNLGHGILPDAKIECVQAMLDAVERFTV
jgi:uroporphyrinogen decarboxylase